MPPKVGDRIEGEKPLECVSLTPHPCWSPVCPRCDKPMLDCDSKGSLCCGTCGLRAVDR